MFRSGVGEGDTPFNMAMMFYFRINELLSAKDRASISNDVGAYYSCLKAVFNNVYFQIKKEEGCEKIKNDLEKAARILSSPIPQQANMAMTAMNIKMADVKAILDEVDMQLMVLMDKKKMIFPRIQVTQGIGAVREKYGLDIKK